MRATRNSLIWVPSILWLAVLGIVSTLTNRLPIGFQAFAENGAIESVYLTSC